MYGLANIHAIFEPLQNGNAKNKQYLFTSPYIICRLDLPNYYPR